MAEQIAVVLKLGQAHMFRRISPTAILSNNEIEVAMGGENSYFLTPGLVLGVIDQFETVELDKEVTHTLLMDPRCVSFLYAVVESWRGGAEIPYWGASIYDDLKAYLQLFKD